MRGASDAESCGVSDATVLIGGGGHARVVADAARVAGVLLAGFVDDDPSASVPGLQHLGPLWGPLGRAGEPWHMAIGDVATRARVLETLGGLAVAVVHPRAIVSERAMISSGVFVGPGAVVNTGAVLGEHAIVNSAAVVEHDVRVGRASHVAPGAVLCGAVEVGRGCLVGAGAVLLPGVTVGDGAVVGAGAVVRGHVPPRAVAVGVPARVLEVRGVRPSGRA